MGTSNSVSGEELARLADEKAALLRVATLVARGAPPEALFGPVNEEAGRLVGADIAALVRFDADDMVTVVASWPEEAHATVGGRWPLEGDSMAPRVLRSGRPERIDDWSAVEGPLAAFIREELGIVSTIGVPITVEGRTWGVLMVQSTQPRLFPADTEARAAAFAELVATAIVNERARAELRRLADEQAALRRVATLVARRRPHDEVFAAVAEEVARVLGLEDTRLFRYEDDGDATVIADRGPPGTPLKLGSRISLEGKSVTALVLRTGRPARVYDLAKAGGQLAADARVRGVHSAIGTPILVDGRPWGAIVAGSANVAPFATGTESLIAEFAELVASAISNP